MQKVSHLIFFAQSSLTIKLQQMISYDRYTELLSKTIHKTITGQENETVAEYEAAQPKSCPKCGAEVMSFLQPFRVVHDVEKCAGKAGG